MLNLNYPKIKNSLAHFTQYVSAAKHEYGRG